MQFLLQHGAIN